MTGRPIDCSLSAYGRVFHEQFTACLANNPISLDVAEAHCFVSAAMKAIENMHARCSVKSGAVDCTPHGYADAVIEELDLKNRVLKVVFGKVEGKVQSKLDIPGAQAVVFSAGGAALGGAVGAMGGAVAMPRNPRVGAAIAAVPGARKGAVVGGGVYGAWKVYAAVGEAYDAVKDAYGSLVKHSSACGADPNILPDVNQVISIPSFGKRIFLTKQVAKTLLAPKPIQAQKDITKPIPASPLSKPVASTPLAKPLPCPSPPPPLEPIDPQLFSWIDVEEAAGKIVDLAADFAGVTGAISQGKELKQLFATLLSDPENAPKILFDQLVQEPERMLLKIISSPEELFSNGQGFLNDPSLANALATIGTIYTVISIANDILPVLSKVIQKSSKNPLSAPVVMTEEMTKLMVMKIVGVVKLAEGLLKRPGKTLEHMGKGIIKAPVKLYKNIIHFGGRKKRKHKKRKARELALKLATEKAIRLENEKLKQAIIDALPSCYTAAKHQWLIQETTTPEIYLTSLIEDWKQLRDRKPYREDCAHFIRMIHDKLNKGELSEVSRLSPTAHLKEISAPPLIAYAIMGIAKETLEFACQTASFARVVKAHQISSDRHHAEINAYAAVNRELEAVVGGKSAEALAKEIALGLADAEKKARCRALLN